MNSINGILNSIFDIFLLPVARLNPWFGMIEISLFTAIFMLLIFRLTSNQKVVRQAKNDIKAHLLEMRLYGHDLKVQLKAQAAVLKANLRYMAANLKPLLVMVIPLVFILAQLNLRFDKKPIQPGETVIIKLKFFNNVDLSKKKLELVLPEGLNQTSPPVMIKDEYEVNWQVRALKKGDFTILINVNGEQVGKSVTVNDDHRIARVSARASSGSILSQILYPGEKSLPKKSSVRTIEVLYQPATLNFFGFAMHWLIAFLGLSILLGLTLKGLFKVEI